MKQKIILTDQEQPAYVSKFINLWKTKKKYPLDEEVNVGQVIELLIATSYNLHKDNSDSRFFNNILVNAESVIAWDGEELIDMLFYEVIQNIKRLISHSRTFNEDIASNQP